MAAPSLVTRHSSPILKSALGPERLLLPLAPRGGLLRFLLVGARPEDDQHLADLLYRRGVERRADFRNQAVAPLAVFAQHADLDEFVALQREVDFPEHARR